MVDTLIQDFRYAVRTLARRPGFTAAALACLGLGIGATSAAFSVVHGVLYRALPFEEPDEIVSIEGRSDVRGVSGAGLTFADLEDLRAAGPFEDVGGASGRSVTLTGGEQAERVRAAAVTPNLFPLLGVAPAIGRGFHADEGAPAGFEEVVLIGDDLWRRRFGGARDVVGRTLEVNRRSLVIVGVMPPGFGFPEFEELWLPLGAASATERSARSVWGVGRLAEGGDAAVGEERLAGLSARLEAEYPDSHRGWSFSVRPFRDRFIHPMGRRLFQLMLGAVALVLLIACANVANLLLVRGVERERELAVRAAIGAGRGRVLCQLLTEALTLGLAGAALGWLVALWSVAWLVSRIPEDMAYWMKIDMDAPVLAFTVGVAMLTALLFGILPALRGSRTSAVTGIGDRLVGRTGGGGLRGALVTSEVALSLVLLVGAGLFVRSFLRIDAADPGFAPEGVISFRTVLSGDRYDPMAAKAEFFQTAVERIEALPGVLGAVATSSIPADDGGPQMALSTREGTPPEERVTATVVVSTAGFFDALGIDLASGREFTSSEARDTASAVAIVGESLAGRLWPGESPLDRRVRIEDGDWYRIVGVAPDLQYEEFGEETARSRLQLHLPQGPAGWRGMAFLVRADDPAAVSGAVRAELAALDPGIAPYELMTMEERLRLTTWPQRFFAVLFSGYGSIALVLALTGVYGVVAYEVGRRRREIGLRMALGASRSLVVREVAGRAARLAVLGTGLGIVGALLLGRGMRTVLYGVRETDLPTFLIAAGLMAGAALLAGWIPARRAARLEPSEALRSD